MMAEIRDALSKPFGPEMIRTKKGQGGREMQYISHGGVTKRLNDAAPDWSAEMIERWITETGGALHCVGGVMRMTIDGVTREEAGGPTRLGTLADDLKNTYSDCLKRCAMRFGVALDMWESADENDEDAQPTPPPANQSTRAGTPPARRSDPPSAPRPAAAPVAAGPPYTGQEMQKIIDDAWQAAEDGRMLDDIRDDLNKLRHRMTKQQRTDTLTALGKIEARHFAPASQAG